MPNNITKDEFQMCQSYRQIYQDLYRLFSNVKIVDVLRDFIVDLRNSMPFSLNEVTWILTIFLILVTLRRLTQAYCVDIIKRRLGMGRKDANRWFYNAWQLAYYSLSSSLSLYIYLVNIKSSPGHYLNHYSVQVLPNLNDFNYGFLDYLLMMGSVGYYIDASYWLITDSKMLFRLRDTLILLAHHSITIFTIFLIYKSGTGIFLAYIFIFEDPCDIILHSLKLLDLIINRSHLGESIRWLDMVRTIVFLMLVTVWFHLRVNKLPGCLHSLSLGYWTGTSLRIPFMLMFNISHLIIISMNLYWTFALTMVLFKFIMFYLNNDKTISNDSLSIQDPVTSDGAISKNSKSS